MLQFWKISTNDVPLCFAASLIIFYIPFESTSKDLAIKVAPADSANSIGFKGMSGEPKGVLFVTFPCSDVGEYWPFVSP